MKFPPAAKVGLLTIISLAILIFGIMWLKGRTLSTGEHFTVQFHDVDGMRSGAMVQIMGLRVGQVTDVKPVVTEKDNYVKVDFIITNDKIFIPDGSELSVQQSGIIGEKFLEITPPEIKNVLIPLEGERLKIKPDKPVKIAYEGQLHDIGIIKKGTIVSKVLTDYKETPKGLQVIEQVKDYYSVDYIITRAGLEIPDYSLFEVEKSANYLLITPPDKYIVSIPPKDIKFTTSDPLRIKTFMELQVESAEALKATNDKINALLQPEQIEALKDTLKNTEKLTARATDILDEASDLMVSSKDDLERLVDSSTLLSQNMISISNNVNAIIGDPQLQEDLKATVKSIKESSKELSEILADPNLKDTIALTKETTQNVSELVSQLKNATGNQELKSRLDKAVTNLDTSLDKLSTLLNRTDSIASSQEENIKQIITESAEISDNMKKFSKKLNKRFLLFRLLF